MKTICVKIHRFNQEKGSYLQEYQVEVKENQLISVLNLLEQIYQNQDPTLSFFSHAACKQAACGKCLVKVNGKVKLACKEKVEADFIEIGPHSQDVVKDLVCR